jgi:FkbM family methyltransferase
MPSPSSSFESASSVGMSERSGIFRRRDIVGGLMRHMYKPAPYVAERILWRRDAPRDPSKQAVERLVRRGDVAADIGAHIGLFTARFRSLVGGHGHVHAFEPLPANVAGLRSMARMARETITVHPVALSDTNGTAVLRLPPLDGQAYQALATLEANHGDLPATVQEIEVPTRRLDDVLVDTARLDFVKCDVEGHEDSVFAGGREVMAEHAPNVLVELEYRHRGRDFAETIDWLESLGLEGFGVYPDGLRPVSQFDLERDQLPWIESQRDRAKLPKGYIYDFVFARPGHDLGALMA